MRICLTPTALEAIHNVRSLFTLGEPGLTKIATIIRCVEEACEMKRIKDAFRDSRHNHSHSSERNTFFDTSYLN